MSRWRPSPAVLVALLALFFALGGTSYSASRTSPGQPAAVAQRSPAAGRGSDRAYALVVPICDTCKPPLHFTPLDAARSVNVSLGTALPGSPLGTWCFELRGGIDPHTATVVASVEGSKTTTVGTAGATSVESAQWVAEGAGCPHNQIEIQTVRYTAGTTGLTATPERDIAFSFVVD